LDQHSTMGHMSASGLAVTVAAAAAVAAVAAPFATTVSSFAGSLDGVSTCAAHAPRRRAVAKKVTQE
jgi:hypothetical protein